MHVRKARLPFLLMIFVFLCFGGCRADRGNDLADFCYSMNERIKNIEFYRADVLDGAIKLYDNEGTLIGEIPFDDYPVSEEIVYIRKDESRVYFILGGAVDDEYGIMFINDVGNGLLDGVHSIERMGRNFYEYRTS